jgi:hypothetical protein
MEIQPTSVVTANFGVLSGDPCEISVGDKGLIDCVMRIEFVNYDAFDRNVASSSKQYDGGGRLF